MYHGAMRLLFFACLSVCAEEKAVIVDGASLAYFDSGGNGEPVVLLHAASGGKALFEKQHEPLRNAGYRVIAVDRRGYGGSAGAPATGTAANDLHAVLTQLKLDPVHLIGTAAGGGIAIDYALSHPDQVRSLTIANSLGGIQDDSYREMLKRLMPEPFSKMPLEFRELGPSYRAADEAGTARWLALSGRKSASQSAMNNKITFDALSKLTIPVLLITGDADLYAPPATLSLFSQALPGAESVIINGAGHSAFWERAAEFNKAVIRFLGKH